MLVLSRALRARGHSLEVGCPEAPVGNERSIASEARRARFEPALTLQRARGVRWLRDRNDARALGEFLQERDIEIVHTWHTRDHLLALRAARGRRRRGETRVVRSYAAAERISGAPWNRWLFGSGSDGLLLASPETATRNGYLRRGRHSLGSLGAIETERFEAERLRAGRKRVRQELGLADGQPLIGVVARVQRHRRFDLLFDAMLELAAARPNARLMIVGRGTHFDEIAREPVERLGLTERVLFAGYRVDDYADVLSAIDLFTFLVPGSDGSCRALLEAMACGIPAVVSRRGALPEIVLDGETGIQVSESPAALAAAWSDLLENPERRRRMGQRARERALELFSPHRLAERVEALYEAACRL